MFNEDGSRFIIILFLWSKSKIAEETQEAH